MSKDPHPVLMNIVMVPVPFGMIPGAGLWEIAAIVCACLLVGSFTHYLKAYRIKQELAALQRCHFSHSATRFRWENVLAIRR